MDASNPPPAPGTAQWFNSIVAPALGYSSLREYQLELSQKVFQKKDVVLIAGTGSGKSGMLHIPLMATKLHQGRALGLSVVPTKILGEDQVRAAQARNIRAITIHQDSLRHAVNESPPRNLIAEVREGLWDLVIVTPEMLYNDCFRSLLKERRFTEQLSLMFVDECHLVYQHGVDFREKYRGIGTLLRSSIPSSVPWIAVTATLPPGPMFDFVMSSLQFRPGAYELKRLRIDNANIKYIPRFLQHSVSGLTFLDLSWLVCRNITSVTQLKKTIICCTTIEVLWRIGYYLESLLPDTLPNRDRIILPFHSVMSQKFRLGAIEDFRNGTTRILIGTAVVDHGVDVADVEQVVIVMIGPISAQSFDKMTQQIGRGGRNGQPARAIVYAPIWVQDVPTDMITTKQGEADEKRRGDMCQDLRAWFNPSPSKCPRRVFCDRYMDVFQQPAVCCEVHNPDDADLKEVQARSEEVAPRKRNATVRADGTHYTLDKKTISPSIRRIIDRWAVQTWNARRGENLVFSSSLFFASHLRARLVDKLHVVTGLAELRKLLWDWEYLNEHEAQLLACCLEILETTDEIATDRRKKALEEMQAEDVQMVKSNEKEDIPEDVTAGEVKEGATAEVARPKRVRLKLGRPQSPEESIRKRQRAKSTIE